MNKNILQGKKDKKENVKLRLSVDIVRNGFRYSTHSGTISKKDLIKTANVLLKELDRQKRVPTALEKLGSS